MLALFLLIIGCDEDPPGAEACSCDEACTRYSAWFSRCRPNSSYDQGPANCMSYCEADAGSARCEEYMERYEGLGLQGDCD